MILARSFKTRPLTSLLLTASLGLGAFGSAQAATTFHVRTDGGDASQCTGRADAAYTGSGTGQACAWKHPYFALAPGGTKRIAGGDTLIISSGSYMMGTGAPGAGSCSASSCFMPPVPSGTSASAKTRIIGKPGTPAPKLWGTKGVSRVINLDGSSNVEIGHLEITDQSDCVSGHSNSTAACSSSMDYAARGLYARNSSNVWLRDLNIHGLAHTGINAGLVNNWTLDRVRINANGRAGWDGNVGTDSSNSGAIILRNVEIGWNGCGERWQTGTPWACWGQQGGGYGDGLGMYYTGGQWLIEDSFIHHNTSDGLDLRYMDGEPTTNVIVRRLYAVGNAGNQAKIRGNSTIENSVLVSNCGFFSGKYYMVSGDHCRAAGNTLQLVFTAGDVATVRHNTITGEGGTLIGAIEGDSSAKVNIQNNIIMGFTTFLDPSRYSNIYYANNTSVVASFAGNLVYNVRGTCPAGSICNTSPKLANMTLASFDAQPLAGSPVIDKVAMLSGMNSDFLMQPRPSGTSNDIGAYEVQSGTAAPLPPSPTCTRAAPTLTIAGPTAAVAAGTAVTYNLSVRNNDTSACSNTTFNLARTVPAGWTGTLSTTSVALAPGATASPTLQVTSANGSTAGGYGIGTGASSSIGAAHTANASATYTVKDVQSEPAPAGLTQTVSTSKSSYVAGETVSMATVVLNNGQPVSGASVRFSALKPNGINTIVVKAITNASGYAVGTFVSGTGSSSIGTYKLTADATSGSLSATATSTFSVLAAGSTPAPAPTCTRAAPTVSIAGPTAAVAAGTAATYSISVRNNDTSACSSTTFNLARTVPTGWTGTLSSASVALVPGAIATPTLQVTSASNAVAGSYSIAAGSSSSVGSVHTQGATASYTVQAPAVTGLTETVSTSKSSYKAGETVSMTARVLNNGQPVSGASVKLSALKPNGINTVVVKATTNSNGYAVGTFVSGTGSSSVGTYKLTADATSGSLSATAKSTFSVTQ